MEGSAATERVPREVPRGQIRVRLTSLPPHGHPVGKDGEQVYDNTEKSPSAE